jgi:hypothetical protein
VDTAALREAAHRVGDLADKVTSVYDTLICAVTGDEGASHWGSDDPGTQFANGQNGTGGYVKTAANLEGALSKSGATLSEYADNITQAADLIDKMEAQNAG